MRATFKATSIIALLISVCILMTFLSACDPGTASAVSAEQVEQIEEAADYDYNKLGAADYVFVGKVVSNDVLNYDPFVPVEELPTDENGEPISTGHYKYCTVQVVRNAEGSLVTDTDIKLESTADRSQMTRDSLPAVGEDYIFCVNTYLDGTLNLIEESLNIPYSEEVLAKIMDAVESSERSELPIVSKYDAVILSAIPEGVDAEEYILMENIYNTEVYSSDYVFVGKVKGENGIIKTPIMFEDEKIGDNTDMSYNIEVEENIKGSLVTDREIELLKRCGVDDLGAPVVDDWDFLPEIGETYIFCAHTEEDADLTLTVYMSTFPYSEETLEKIKSVYEAQGEYTMRHEMSKYDTAFEQ